MRDGGGVEGLYNGVGDINIGFSILAGINGGGGE